MMCARQAPDGRPPVCFRARGNPEKSSRARYDLSVSERVMSPTDRKDEPNYRHSLLDRLLGVSDGRARPHRPGRVLSTAAKNESVDSSRTIPTAVAARSGLSTGSSPGSRKTCAACSTRPVPTSSKTSMSGIRCYQSLWTYGLKDLSDRTPSDVAARARRSCP